MVTTGREQIAALLERSPHAMRAWESSEFDRLSRGRPIVLMGAGGLGRRTLAAMRRRSMPWPLAFADNGRAGTMLDGLPVLSPAQAAQQFASSAAFVVTIWGAHLSHRYEHSREQLRALGCDVVLPFPPLFWKLGEEVLPFYLQDLPSRVVEQRAAVLAGYELWADDRSRAEYVAQVGLRAAADFDHLPHPISGGQYFPDGLFTWSDDEWIFDGGAYDGDTVRALGKFRDNQFGHLLSVEPDPANFEKLQATVAALPREVRQRVECRPVALGASRTTLHLEPTGTAGTFTKTGASTTSVAVAADTIDALVGDARPTYIKLDIEGFEPDALAGGRETIRRHAPVLAVCVYHLQDHLWRIPLMLREWCPDASMFLRPHNEEGWDLVCYVVPPHRLERGVS